MTPEEKVIAAMAEAKKAAAMADVATTTAPKKPIKPKEPPKLIAGQVLFSSVFGYVPAAGDFGITVLPDNTDDDIKALVPKLDPDYEVQKVEAALLVAGLEDNDKTMITGPTGSGKSSLVKYVCAKLNRPFIRINMSGDVESSALFGTLVVRGGATVWQDGAITEACKYGAVCLVDEWELMPAEISMGMQNLLETDGYLYLKEKPGNSADRTVIPTADFRLVFAGNTVGQGDVSGAHSGVGVQNTATIDRFTNTIHLGYLEANHEIAIITRKTGIAKDLAKDMVKLAGLIRSAYTQGKLGLTMSPRTLINWGLKMKRHEVKMALTMAYINKLNDDDKASVLELYTKVFGE